MQIRTTRPWRRLAGPGAAAALMFAALMPGASADESAATPPISADLPDVTVDILDDFATGRLTAAMLEDLQWQADSEGITLEEAILKYAWHEPFAVLAHQLREGHPDEYAGARIDAEAATAWIAFKGHAPDPALESIAAFGHAVEVVEDRGYSESELEAQLLEAHYDVLDQTDLAAAASSGYDIATGVITIEFVPRSGTLNAAGVARELADRIHADEDRVLIVAVESPSWGDDALVRGGANIVSCTSGFNLKASNGVRNASTAGHCPDNQEEQDLGVDLFIQASHLGTWGDVQRHTVPLQDSLDDDFRYNWGGYRDTSGVGWEVEGQLLYKFGQTTGRTSDTVYQLNHCNGSRCHLTAMHNRKASGGDSGGPWYYGNTAYGLHQGYKWWNLKNRDLFTPAHYVDDALPGWPIATN